MVALVTAMSFMMPGTERAPQARAAHGVNDKPYETQETKAG